LSRLLWVLTFFFALPPARQAFAAELDVTEPGVVDLPAAAPNTDDAAWKPVEDARGSSRFAVALDAWLLATPTGRRPREG